MLKDELDRARAISNVAFRKRYIIEDSRLDRQLSLPHRPPEEILYSSHEKGCFLLRLLFIAYIRCKLFYRLKPLGTARRKELPSRREAFAAQSALTNNRERSGADSRKHRLLSRNDQKKVSPF